MSTTASIGTWVGTPLLPQIQLPSPIITSLFIQLVSASIIVLAVFSSSIQSVCCGLFQVTARCTMRPRALSLVVYLLLPSLLPSRSLPIHTRCHTL